MLKVVITLILLLLLEGIKRLVFRSGQPSDFFYYNLLSCAQLIILLGGIIIIITRPLFRRLVKQRRMLWQVMFFLALLGLLELGCNYLLNHPRSIPAAVFPAFKFYYDHFECRIIQYEPEHTRFHPALFYKLKNDQRFTYSNREYSNAFHTNSKGLRDDEPSLRAPEIICLGDSYTLGWGAEEAEAWPTLVQKQTGLNLLNAGMSSYGTARESMVLAGLDTSNVKYIIWQYCANDAEENSAYLAGNRSLPTHQPQDLDSLMELHSWTRKYFPGRHFFTITKLAVSQFLARKSNLLRRPCIQMIRLNWPKHRISSTSSREAALIFQKQNHCPGFGALSNSTPFYKAFAKAGQYRRIIFRLHSS